MKADGKWHKTVGQELKTVILNFDFERKDKRA